MHARGTCILTPMGELCLTFLEVLDREHELVDLHGEFLVLLGLDRDLLAEFCCLRALALRLIACGFKGAIRRRGGGG